MGTPRKRVVVSMEVKLAAIKRLDNGEKVYSVAKDFGVGNGTVCDWKKNRRQIERWCASRATSVALKHRKTMRKCDYPRVSDALYDWFNTQNGVSGPVLQQKALELRDQLSEGGTDFTASTGWLSRWKRRYGIRHSGEKPTKASPLSEESADALDTNHEFESNSVHCELPKYSKPIRENSEVEDDGRLALPSNNGVDGNSLTIDDHDPIQIKTEETRVPMENKNFHNTDHYEKVVLVWAEELEGMDPEQQLYAKKFINEILFEGRMGTLHRHSMQLNVNSEQNKIFEPSIKIEQFDPEENEG